MGYYHNQFAFLTISRHCFLGFPLLLLLSTFHFSIISEILLFLIIFNCPKDLNHLCSVNLVMLCWKFIISLKPIISMQMRWNEEKCIMYYFLLIEFSTIPYIPKMFSSATILFSVSSSLSS